MSLVRVVSRAVVPQIVYAGMGIAIFVGAIEDAKPSRAVLYPTLEEIGYWQLGHALAQHFSPGSGVASPVREALIEGRLAYCPQRICPERATEEAFWECLSVHAMECDGNEPVGYVVTTANLYDPNAVARRDMDRWVASRWEHVAEVKNPKFEAWIYQIPREEIPDLVQAGDKWNSSGAVGPPGGGPVGPATPPLGPDGRPLPGPVKPPPGSMPPEGPLPASVQSAP